MALTETRGKLRATLDELKGLQGKADVTQEDVEKIKSLIAQGKALKSELDLLGEAAAFETEMAASKGMINLAGTNGPADVLGMKETGQAVATKVGNVLVTDEGEPLIDKRTYQTISSKEYKDAFRQYLRVGINGLKSDSIKVLQEASDAAGGFLVPEDILSRLLAREPAPLTLAGRVTSLTTGRDRLTVPQVVWTTDNLYTSGMRVTWTGEVPASATAMRVTEPVFGQTAIPIYTAMMSMPLTNDMVEDANYPLVNWCTSKFGETIDLLKENMILNGTGVAQPEGILTNANFITNHVHSGAAAALTWDGILALGYALPEQYDGNSVFVMSKTNCALALSRLVDGDGRPYWANGTTDSGLANTQIQKPLLGYPVIFNAFSDTVAAGHYPIVFGDLRGYWLVNRIGFSIQVLRELYAETNQILLLGRVRFGGKLVEDWKVRGQFIAA
jgi:HK97 family phage major capsid protein